MAIPWNIFAKHLFESAYSDFGLFYFDIPAHYLSALWKENDAANIDDVLSSRIGFLVLTLIIPFMLSTIYTTVAQLYVTMIGKEQYSFSKQFKFAIRNLIKIFFIKALILTTLISCALILLILKIRFHAFDTIIVAILLYFILLLSVAPILLFSDIILILERCSIYDAMKRSMEFAYINFTKLVELLSVIFCISLLYWITTSYINALAIILIPIHSPQ